MLSIEELTIKHDTFILGLAKLLDQLDVTIDGSYLFGRTGHGARLSVAMNTRTGKEIGHPSSAFSFDIVGVAENCFPDTGIDATVYVGPGYATRARKTAAQTDRDLADHIVLLDRYTLDQTEPVEGNLLYADHEGKWMVAESSEDFEVDWDQMPFGPVFLDLHGFTRKKGFPASTFRYLVDTLERGEEPMEIRGRNNYSTVSGWKAFARWMQSYSVPLPEVQHENLSKIPFLLLERRQHLVTFLEQLIDEVEGREIGLIKGLLSRYKPVVNVMKQLDLDDLDLQDVREIYFNEQKTLTFYKKIDTYLEHHR